MTPVFQVYPLGKIRAEGMVRDRMERTANKILHHIDLQKDFIGHFRNRKENPNAYGGFVGCGMLLDGVVKAAAQGICGEELQKFKNKFVEDVIGCQSADGAISIFAGPERGGWDNHEQAYLIQALVWEFVYTGNRKALDSAVALGRYLIVQKTVPNIGVEQALLMLYEQTRDSVFLDYCVDFLKIRYPLEGYDSILNVNGTHHVYTCLARTLAQLKYVQVSGDPDPHLLDSMHEVFDRILHRGYAFITGGITGGLYWGEVWDRSQLGVGSCAETCAAAYLLRNSIQMLALSGDPVYGDIFDRTMYNTFFASQSTDGIQQKYFIPFNEAGQWYDHDTYCCPNNFKRMVFELPQGIFFKAEDGIAVNLYNAAILSDDLAELHLIGNYPDSESMELHLTPKTEQPFTLYFRIPRWCKNAVVQVNGESFKGTAGTFLPIRKQWKACTIQILLPMQIRFIAGNAAQAEKAAVLRGPVVYGWKRVSGISTPVVRFALTPEPVYANGRITVHTAFHSAGFQHPELELIPFWNPDREVTYFFAPERTEPDELFQ